MERDGKAAGKQVFYWGVETAFIKYVLDLVVVWC